MKNRHILATVSLAAALLTTGRPAVAQTVPIDITVDENGRGIFRNPSGPVALPGVLARDPGPGGLASALTYNLLGPPALVAGDVLLQEGVGGPILDVIRFNPAGTGGFTNYPASLVFYSDNTDGFDSLGDTPSPPTAFYSNTVTILEVGPEGNNGATYVPTANQPGYVGTFNPITYHFVSDAVVPEPSSLILCGVAGGLGLAIHALRRRWASA